MFLSIICNSRFSTAVSAIPTINDAKIGNIFHTTYN